MIPGPCEVSDEVLQAMASKSRAHYGQDWTAIYNQTCYDLKKIIHTKSDLFLTVGSGHLAVEMAIGNLVSPGDEVAIIENGHFGTRLIEIARIYGAKIALFRKPWGKGIDISELSEFIKINSEIKVLIAVHNETSTGAVNPIEMIGQVARDNKILFIVDAVSSVGCMELKVDEWGIDACAGSSQKGLESPPGLAFVTVGERAWFSIENRAVSFQGWYLNLMSWRKYAKDYAKFQPYGITMAVNNVLALQASLSLILQEGLENRYSRHREISFYFRQGLHSLGLRVASDKEVASPSVTTVFCEQFRSDEIVDYLHYECGVEIAGGLGKWHNKTFRVGHMGQGACIDNVNEVLKGINKFLESRVER